MEISRILIVSLMFLVIWKESSSYHHQIRKENHLLKRNKRNHESDQFMRVKQNIKQDEENNEKTETDHTNIVKAKDRFSKNLEQNPVKTFIIPGKIIKMRPLRAKNTNNIDNINKSNVVTKTNSDLVDKSDDKLLRNKKNENFLVDTNNERDKVSKTLFNRTLEFEDVVEKKLTAGEVVDTMTVYKTNSKNNPSEKAEKHSEETINQEFEKPQILKINKHKRKEFIIKKPYENENDDEKTYETSAVKHVSDKYLKNKKVGTSSTTEKHETGNNKEKEEDEKISLNVSIEEQKNKSDNPEVVRRRGDELLPKKHPLFKVIQTDWHISPDTKIEPDTKINYNVARTANDKEFDLVKKQLEDSNDDDDADVIVKNKNVEEVIEIIRAPTIQGSKIPVSYRVPYNYQGASTTRLNDNQPWGAHEQRIDQIDGTTVVSYNNYFKMPTNSNWQVNKNQYYPYSLNDNQHYCYQRYNRPDIGRYVWNNYYNRPNENTKDRIWRSWQNTEYYLKSKDRKIGNEKRYYTVNQNNIADKTKNIQTRNALDMNGYYRNQNISPYL